MRYALIITAFVLTSLAVPVPVPEGPLTVHVEARSLVDIQRNNRPRIPEPLNRLKGSRSTEEKNIGTRSPSSVQSNNLPRVPEPFNRKKDGRSA